MHVAGMGDSRRVYRVLGGKLEGKGQLGRSRRSWEDNIKMDLQKAGWGIDRIDPALDSDRCKHGNEPSGSIKYEEFLDYLSKG